MKNGDEMFGWFKDRKKEIRIILLLFLSFYALSFVFFATTKYKLPPSGEFNSEFISLQTFFEILKNNSFVFLLLLLGSVTFGFLTYINIATNAVNIAFSTYWFIELGGLSISFLIHGVPEYISFFLAALLGLKPIQYHLINKKISLIILFTGVFLVILGSYLETYVSPLILKVLRNY